MKKIHLLVALAFIAAVAACNGGGKTNDGDVPVPEGMEGKVTIGRTSLSDLGLSGPVKSFTEMYETEGGEPVRLVCEFNEKGLLVSSTDAPYETSEGGFLVCDTTFDAKGRVEKVVYHYSNGDIPDDNYMYAYDENGNVLRTWAYEEGNEEYPNYSTFYDYDEKGRLLASTDTVRGEYRSRIVYDYDERGNRILESNYDSEDVERCYKVIRSYDGDNRQIGVISLVEEGDGVTVMMTDTTFVGDDGFKHRRRWENYGDERVYELVYDKAGRITKAVYGAPAAPDLGLDYTYEGDDRYFKTVTLTNNVGSDTFTLGQTDTYGNWTRKYGPSDNIYLGDMQLEDVLDYFMPITRVIEYYGEDQGNNYAYSGNYEGTDIYVYFQTDGMVRNGSIRVGDRTTRLIGWFNRYDGWDILSGFEGEKRVLALYVRHENGRVIGSILSPLFNPMRYVDFDLTPCEPEEIICEKWTADPEDVPGPYAYSGTDELDLGSGILGITRMSDGYDRMDFNIYCSGPGGYGPFDDSFISVYGQTEYYQYVTYPGYDNAVRYVINCYKDFVVVRRDGGDANVMPSGTNPEGVYVRVEAYG